MKIFKCMFLFFVMLITACDDNNPKTVSFDINKEIISFIHEDLNNSEIDDYYITSTYKPRDKLYKPVLYIQRERWDLAIPLLKELVQENNADAMYWLASISGGSVLSGKKMAMLFERSANLGNPYAALRLDSGAKDCDSYLRGYCSKKWGKKARKILESRAKKGDIKSEYQLAIINGVNYRDTLKLALKNAKNNYYYPLYKYIEYSRYLSVDTRKELYNLMIDKNFTPVGQLMNLNFSMDNLSYEFYSKAFIKLKFNSDFWYSNYNINSKLFDKYKKRIYALNVVKGTFIIDLIKSSDSEGNINPDSVKYKEIVKSFNSDLDELGLDTIKQQEIKDIKSESIKISNNFKPLIYIDEFNYDPNVI
ncbi:SEL1-like repeat protein [Vibrio nitrifigilis]|uniref:Sel1 repeat family protein n=1 Tax=Vibrio nitrifigilis TaxID=2789781 RepID=A0ABS0GMA8_9VIBR|nr:hypothetical protein [Vibrio nitrifigilis]MBF9003445.1 hypothetical protein [Vibrio nitrifigilis]